MNEMKSVDIAPETQASNFASIYLFKSMDK